MAESHAALIDTIDYAPWTGGVGGVRMGLAPIANADWLQRPAHFDLRRRERCELWAAWSDRVYAQRTGPRVEHAVSELCSLIRDQVRSQHPWHDHYDLPLLMGTALNTAEDLCLLLPRGDDWLLEAAALFAPSFWRLADKLGQPLQSIHAPVAGLEQKIGARVRDFLAKLQPGRPFGRGNWHLHTTPALFHPEPDNWSLTHTLTPDNVAQRLFLRTERQTLRKLPASGALVFTILVRVHPLQALREAPRLAADLLQAMAAMPALERRARHVDEYEPHLATFLARGDKHQRLL